MITKMKHARTTFHPCVETFENSDMGEAFLALLNPGQNSHQSYDSISASSASTNIFDNLMPRKPATQEHLDIDRETGNSRVSWQCRGEALGFCLSTTARTY